MPRNQNESLLERSSHIQTMGEYGMGYTVVYSDESVERFETLDALTSIVEIPEGKLALLKVGQQVEIHHPVDVLQIQPEIFIPVESEDSEVAA